MNCPKCDSSSIAEIFWGLPADMDSLKKSLEKKEIVLGGCVVSGNDPKWECNNCNHRWKSNSENSDKIDSFDFDQGFNLDEVYDN